LILRCMKNDMVFILNRNSGRVKQKLPQIYRAVDKYINKDVFSVRMAETSSPEEARKIIAELENGYNPVVVAVGGDGTVNKTLNHIAGKNIMLGIIPLGSGNALAREMKIPLHIEKAVQKLNDFRVRSIDLMRVNRQYYGACVGGIGFDALIAQKFENLTERGLKNYIRLSVQEFFKYKNIEVVLQIGQAEYRHNAFLVSFANTSQYGNNAYIAPKAKPDDGMLDIVVMKKLEVHKTPVLAAKLFTKKIDTYKHLEYYKADKFSLITTSEKMYMHLDGEPIELEENRADVEVLPGLLKVVVG